jgi:hypothetical protein
MLRLPPPGDFGVQRYDMSKIFHDPYAFRRPESLAGKDYPHRNRHVLQHGASRRFQDFQWHPVRGIGECHIA